MKTPTTGKATAPQAFQRSVMFTFLAQAPTLVLFFVASTLMTNVLGEEGRGSFALLQNIIVYINMILGMNLGLGLMFRTARSEGDHRVAVGMASLVLLFHLLAVPIILWVITRVGPMREVFFPGRIADFPYYLYVLLSVILNATINFIASIVQGLRIFTILNRMSILSALLSCAGFATVWSMRGSIPPDHFLPWALGLTLLGVAVQAVLWVVAYIRHIGLPPIPCFDLSVIRPFMTFTLTGHLINVINLINYRFDIWVVDQWSGTANLGLYAVAVGLGQVLFNIPEPLSRVVQPYLYASDSDDMMRRFGVIARLNFTLVSFLCLCAWVVAPWLLPWLFGEAFAGSVSALRLLLPGIAFCAAYKLLSVVLTKRGLLRYNLFGAIIAASITVVLDLVLIPRYGINGAAMASTVAYLSILVVTCTVLFRRLRIPVSELFLMRPSDLSLLRSMFLRRDPSPRP